jgi:hypothetical protein
MEQPREDFATPRNDRYMVALWEGAVALKALEKNIPPLKKDGSTLEQQLRFGRAMRLAFGTVNEAVYSLLGLPVWDLGVVDNSNSNDPVLRMEPMENVAVTKTDSALCRKALGLGSAKEHYHVSVNGTTDTPGRGVYFDPEEQPHQFTFYSDSGGCHRISRWGEAPNSDLVHIDAKLRYYAVRTKQGNPQTSEKTLSRYTFRGLRWTPDCKPDQKTGVCEKSWEVSSTGKSMLLGKDLRYYDESLDRFLLSGDEEPRALALAPALESDLVEALPNAGDDGCTGRLSNLGYPQHIVCAMNDSLIAVVSWTSKSNQEDTRGEQMIDILVVDEMLVADKENGKDVVKLPIARLHFTGEKITRLWLDARQSAMKGKLWLQVKSGARLEMTWGGEALRETACTVLRKLPPEKQLTITDSPLHSPFFTEIAKSKEGIINRYNDFECVCGENECDDTPEQDG